MKSCPVGSVARCRRNSGHPSRPAKEWFKFVTKVKIFLMPFIVRYAVTVSFIFLSGCAAFSTMVDPERNLKIPSYQSITYTDSIKLMNQGDIQEVLGYYSQTHLLLKIQNAPSVTLDRNHEADFLEAAKMYNLKNNNKIKFDFFIQKSIKHEASYIYPR